MVRLDDRHSFKGVPVMAVSLHKPAAALSCGTADLLIDLIEIKIGCMAVWDREDARELKALEKARCELAAMLGRPVPQPIAAMPAVCGRRPAVMGSAPISRVAA